MGSWLLGVSTIRDFCGICVLTLCFRRSFLVKSYKPLKAANPDLPILIRECSGVEPMLVMRLDKGVEIQKSLKDLSEPEITNLLLSKKAD